MLQQTQITTVLERGYYTRWLERFPDIPTLAAATEAEALRAWEGLGYYRRARNLQKLAKLILQDYDGQFPTDPATILSLPGIGPYTAGPTVGPFFPGPVGRERQAPLMNWFSRRPLFGSQVRTKRSAMLSVPLIEREFSS